MPGASAAAPPEETMALRTFRIRGDLGHYNVLARRYETARAGIPLLEPYPTLDELVSTLSNNKRVDKVTRSHILAALVARIQAGASPDLWSAVVLDAFRGMLGTLLKGLKGVEPEEASAIVAKGFCEALRGVRPERDPDFFAASVRQETRRAVFRSLKRGRSDALWKAPEEAAPPSDAPRKRRRDKPAPPEVHSWFEPPPEVDVEDLADTRSLPAVEPVVTSRTLASRGISNEHLLLAHGVRGGLRRLAEHLFPHVDEHQREAVYRFLLRRARSLSRQASGQTSGSGNAGEG
jgi:hypothetical protein